MYLSMNLIVFVMRLLAASALVFMLFTDDHAIRIELLLLSIAISCMVVGETK